MERQQLAETIDEATKAIIEEKEMWEALFEAERAQWEEDIKREMIGATVAAVSFYGDSVILFFDNGHSAMMSYRGITI